MSASGNSGGRRRVDVHIDPVTGEVTVHVHGDYTGTLDEIVREQRGDLEVLVADGILTPQELDDVIAAQRRELSRHLKR
jgi:hypothetical protein